MVSGKKVALWGCIGCGGVLLLVLLTLGGGVGYIAYSGYQFGQDIGKTYGEVAEGYEALEQQTFVPPEDGVMDEERMKSFLRVRAELAEHTRENFQKLEETGNRIGKQFDSPGIADKIRGIGTIKEIVHLAVNLAAGIGQEHVRLLTDQDMTASEYQWLTRTYLGTMSKAEENGNEALAKLWKDYLDRFDSARRKARDINMNLGNRNIRGSDMNREKLQQAIDSIVFLPENARLVGQTVDEFQLGDDEEVLDFLAVHLREIIDELSKGMQ